MIFVNFKTYEEATGRRAIALIKLMEEVAEEAQVKIIPVVQAADIKEAVENSKLEIWVQKIDPVTFGAHTGAILPEAVLEDGAVGTFLNHSENKFSDPKKLQESVGRAKDVGLKTLVFASDTNELTTVCAFTPTFIAYEPPEFIGSTQVSVAQSKPEIIAQASVLAKEKGIPLIVGAGIHSKDDVRKSLELGAVGVAVATDIVKAENPRAELTDLVEGFR